LSLNSEIFYCFSVSQFTLYGILKGNKPDFHVAMTPQLAKPFYDALVGRFQKAYAEDRIKGVYFLRSCFWIPQYNVLGVIANMNFLSWILCDTVARI
jgi:D-tyrosyl-tRNA(Tyr) deacylase